jgi:hypothetical protein
MWRSRLIRLAIAVTAVTLWLWPGAASAGIISADFDGDGVDDVVRVSPQSPRVLTILSSASHRQVQLRIPGALRALVAADVDHDGNLDLVVGTGTRHLRVWFNNGHGAFHESHVSKRKKHRFTSLPSLCRLRTAPRVRDVSDVAAGYLALAVRTAALDSIPDRADAGRPDAAPGLRTRSLERFGPRPPPSV